MCAIMGILQKNSSVDESILQSMKSVLSHRGHDDNGLTIFNMSTTQMGIFNYGGIAFDRLSIRDLSHNGHQPIKSEENQVMLAMNVWEVTHASQE